MRNYLFRIIPVAVIAGSSFIPIPFKQHQPPRSHNNPFSIQRVLLPPRYQQQSQRTFHSSYFGINCNAPSFSSSSSFRRNTASKSTTLSSTPTPNDHSSQQTEIEMQKHAESIYTTAIAAVNPYHAIKSHLSIDETNGSYLFVRESNDNKMHRYDMSYYNEIVIVGFGKASFPMAKAAAEVMSTFVVGDDMTMKGIVIVKDNHTTAEQSNMLHQTYNITTHNASHPILDNRSIQASTSILTLLSASTPKTFILTLISGGGSALFSTPKPPLNLQDLITTNQCLLESGMSIREMNTIRKCLEWGKGGGLARRGYPGTMMTLVLSDVIRNDLGFIASGPTVKSTTDKKEAWEIVKGFGLEGKLPNRVIEVINAGFDEDDETEKEEGDEVFDAMRPDGEGKLSETFLVGTNEIAVMAAAQTAETLGYHPIILSTELEGEAKDIAQVLISLAKHLKSSSTEQYAMAKRPAVIMAGGETTVTFSSGSGGKGGRNQELGLAAALAMRRLKLRDVVLASIGTDGTDGPTDAAGVVVDGGTVERIQEGNGMKILGEDSLKYHDAYTFFESEIEEETKDGYCKALVKTGPTGTNVADIYFVLIR